MAFAGIKVPDTTLVRDAIDLSRGLLEPYLFNHVMRSWLFAVLLSESVEPAPDPELLAVAAVLHDLGLTDRYTAENRFEVDGANAARAFLKDRGISAQQAQVVWDSIALHTTPTLALHKEPEVVMTHSGIAVDVRNLRCRQQRGQWRFNRNSKIQQSSRHIVHEIAGESARHLDLELGEKGQPDRKQSRH